MPPNIVDKKRVNYNKEGKKKSREKRKAMGLEVKHKQATKAVSGIRTKKHQRKMAHREKMAAKDAAKAAAITQEMQVEAAPAAPAASTKRKAKAGKASKASDAMQE